MLDDDYTLPTQLWMLRDTVRADAYRTALQAVVRPGDRVLDVGAGTGLLSIFAAEAGAAQVTAVERSGRVATLARRLVDATPYGDRITIVAADVHDVPPDPGGAANVLVSEWMGFYAVEENLLGMVCDARDRLCTPDAACLPGPFRVWAAPIEHPPAVADARFWDGRPWGIELGMLIDALEVRPEFGRAVLDPEELCGAPALLWEDDVRTIDPDRAVERWRAAPVFAATRDAQCTGLAIWFDCRFPDGTELSIAPGRPATHWGATVLPLRRPVPVAAGDVIAARITCEPTIPGHSSTFWGVRIGDREWENHGGAEAAEAAFDLA